MAEDRLGVAEQGLRGLREAEADARFGPAQTCVCLRERRALAQTLSACAPSVRPSSPVIAAPCRPPPPPPPPPPLASPSSHVGDSIPNAHTAHPPLPHGGLREADADAGSASPTPLRRLPPPNPPSARRRRRAAPP